MKSRPLITIITVTYNAENVLQCTLNSVCEQEYDRIEHLVVDGRSKDKTLSLIQRYVECNTQAKIPHSIRLICEHDEGLYDAMNKGIQAATGDYLVFLNAGDKLKTPNTLCQLVEKMEWVKGDAMNPAIMYGETDLVNDQGEFVRHRRLTTPDRLHWKSFLQGMRVCHQSFYVRTDLARNHAYNLHYRFSADFDWCIRIMKECERRRLPIVNSHLILTDYLNEGITTKNHRNSLIERMHIMAVHYGWFLTILQHIWFFLRSAIKK